MGFFGTVFWIVVLWLLLRAWRRSERHMALGTRGHWPGWYARESYVPPQISEPRSRPADRQDYVDALESRISDLEERLDFTERLLARGKDPAAQT
jgi:hypothetical protein